MTDYRELKDIEDAIHKLLLQAYERGYRKGYNDGTDDFLIL